MDYADDAFVNTKEIKEIEKKIGKNWSSLTSRQCVNSFSTYCTYIIAYMALYK